MITTMNAKTPKVVRVTTDEFELGNGQIFPLHHYAQQATDLRNERLEQEALENQAKETQDKIMVEQQKQQRDKEAINNKELLALFKQFDG